MRAALPGGEHLPSAVIRARTRQVARFAAAEGRLPADVTDLEPPPNVPRTLILAACDRQQATIERHDTDSRQALLRLQLPARPDPRSYRDWTWVAIPLTLPPTVPAGAALHLPVLRAAGGAARADVAFTQRVPEARRDGHTVAPGIDWGLNTLLSAGAARLHPDGTVTALIPRPARQPGEAPHAARPGDARHPPRHDPPDVAASVRRDTPQRPGPRCPAQRAGTRAPRRPA
ncbi:MAG TPA: hypothetical protein VKG80_20655 [Trebonia sp.]|nr:hypothetical protein [Trebonia sp.]